MRLPLAPSASPPPSASYHPSNGPSVPSRQTRQTTSPNSYDVCEPLYAPPTTTQPESDDRPRLYWSPYPSPSSAHALSQTIDISAPIAQLAAISRTPAQPPLETPARGMEPHRHL